MKLKHLAMALAGAGVLYFGGRMALMMTIRGLRNNNPFNIRKGNDWLGLADSQSDKSFDQFVSPEWGIRAGAKLLLNYREFYGASSVMAIISRFAPPEDNNNTASYISAVSQDLNIAPDATIDVQDYEVLLAMTKAIIKHENGFNPYSDDLIRRGIDLIENYDPDTGVYLYAA